MQRTSFSLAVLVTLGLAALFGLVVIQPEWFAGVLGRETAGHVSHHFREPQHRLHDIAFSLLLGTAVVGLLAELREPSRNVAGQLMALTPFAALLVTVALTNAAVLSVPWVAVGASTVIATLLHPAGRRLFRPFNQARVSRVLLALALVASAPLLLLMSANVALQRTVSDDHAALGHYGYLAALSLTVICVAVLSSLRPDGWRLTALVAAGLAIVAGLASLVFPDVASSLGPAWAMAAMTWGVVFAATAVLHRPFPEASTHAREPAGVGASSRSASTVAAGILVVALLVVFIVTHLAGGGFPSHIPAG